jgi:hypothetical protein
MTFLGSVFFDTADRYHVVKCRIKTWRVPNKVTS